MSADPKQILYGTVHRQETLRMPDGFEPSHLSLALPCRLMGDFRSVVLVLLACCVQRMASRDGVPRRSCVAYR